MSCVEMAVGASGVEARKSYKLIMSYLLLLAGSMFLPTSEHCAKTAMTRCTDAESLSCLRRDKRRLGHAEAWGIPSRLRQREIVLRSGRPPWPATKPVSEGIRARLFHPLLFSAWVSHQKTNSA